MSKKSKLAMTDDLIVDLTLAVSSRIAERRNLITDDMSSREKRDRCECVYVFGVRLEALDKLRNCVKELRREHKLNFSPELHTALQSQILFHDWSSFQPEIDVEQRVGQILA